MLMFNIREGKKSKYCIPPMCIFLFLFSLAHKVENFENILEIFISWPGLEKLNIPNKYFSWKNF